MIYKDFAEVGKAFEQYFSNPDKLSSEGQFNPKLAGQLYQEFEAFLKQVWDAAYQRGRIDEARICHDIQRHYLKEQQNETSD